jgi:basic amino acid/polyamine antiporter, APA family
MPKQQIQPEKGQSTELIRGIGLPAAISLNMIDMIGVGPFITIPLIVAAMGGPQAMLGWIFGAVLSMCDGLVWAELGAALPASGGSYRYLKTIYNPERLGKFMGFLFIWQLTFSAPLSIASGCIGLAQYAGFLFPSLSKVYWQTNLHLLNLVITVTPATFVAMGTCLLAVVLLYRNIQIIGRISEYLWVGVMLTIGWVIVSGVTHFSSAVAFDFPAGAFTLTPDFFKGLGAAMLIAVYDYWGYYNVCFLGGEVRDPGRTIPRAILYSIVFVGFIYIVMNVSILGVIPWRELSETANSDARRYIISVFMQRLYGNWAGVLATVLIMWTAFASVFSLLLGYSRIPYAAAVDGDYFKPFSRIHPEHRFPNVSLLVLGGLGIVFCLFRLQDVIAALVVIRLMVQFLAQTVGVIVFRIRRPDVPRPFKMWLYPVPAILALFGFLYVLVMRKDFTKEIEYGAVILILGTIVFFLRRYYQFFRIRTSNANPPF